MSVLNRIIKKPWLIVVGIAVAFALCWTMLSRPSEKVRIGAGSYQVRVTPAGSDASLLAVGELKVGPSPSDFDLVVESLSDKIEHRLKSIGSEGRQVLLEVFNNGRLLDRRSIEADLALRSSGSTTFGVGRLLYFSIQRPSDWSKVFKTADSEWYVTKGGDMLFGIFSSGPKYKCYFRSLEIEIGPTLGSELGR